MVVRIGKEVQLISFTIQSYKKIAPVQWHSLSPVAAAMFRLLKSTLASQIVTTTGCKTQLGNSLLSQLLKYLPLLHRTLTQVNLEVVPKHTQQPVTEIATNPEWSLLDTISGFFPPDIHQLYLPHLLDAVSAPAVQGPDSCRWGHHAACSGLQQLVCPGQLDFSPMRKSGEVRAEETKKYVKP